MAFSPTLDILVHLYYWSFFSFQSVQCHSFTPLSMINTIQGNCCNNNHAKSVIVWNHLFASLRTKEEIVVSKWDVDPILSYPMNSENHKLPPKSQFCKGRVQRSVNLLTAASVCYFFLTNVLKQNISEALSPLMIIS